VLSDLIGSPGLPEMHVHTHPVERRKLHTWTLLAGDYPSFPEYDVILVRSGTDSPHQLGTLEEGCYPTSLVALDYLRCMFIPTRWSRARQTAAGAGNCILGPYLLGTIHLSLNTT
jgi:hypothetical protein